MSLLETIGYGIAIITGGIITGYVLYWVYLLRNRINARKYLPRFLHHWGLYSGVGLSVIASWTYWRHVHLAIAFGLIACANFGLWWSDVRHGSRPEVAE